MKPASKEIQSSYDIWNGVYHSIYHMKDDKNIVILMPQYFEKIVFIYIKHENSKGIK